MGFLNWLSRGVQNAHIGVPEHFDGTAAAGSWTTITPTNGNRIISILVINTDSTNSLHVSLDGSDKYVTIASEKNLSYSGYIDSFRVKAAAGTATYEIIVNKEPE